MYCTLEDIKSFCCGENKSIWLKDINQEDYSKSFEIDKISLDDDGDIILEFNPEYLID